jgi:spore coat polysaccharide biosynthesis protein SpsF (cytidylyltransferase family)
MHSTRLPGKIMLPLAGRPMIEQIYVRVKRATTVDRVIVAIPKGSWNEMRGAYIPFNDFFLFEGDESDLVARYLACATRHQADLIVRIPCDNPCVDPVYIDEAVQCYQHHAAIFLSNADRAFVVHDQTSYLIDGIGCEVFSLSRLQWLEERTRYPGLTHTCEMLNLNQREHLHQFFHEKHLVSRPYAEIVETQPHATLRLDVNTQADYEFVKDIYDHFQRNDFTTAEVVAYLESKKVMV